MASRASLQIPITSTTESLLALARSLIFTKLNVMVGMLEASSLQGMTSVESRKVISYSLFKVEYCLLAAFKEHDVM